ncbi:PQQ-dependent sugar dehydrogenase [Maribacter sp. MMG018]|uniref:PQQ-dependent sugar dehydrogenase n=1 Tax=Maribacter sp. MMG018 TaxID=2822688 RepID=UPI001B362C33|nr:PQQ-dependent sugar dehydrogenase [Maribacter sp. MMG018]MBQ4915653.1 PQQ-dependent sugar dehydrogenase [Maribacter sp. MMG018]
MRKTSWGIIFLLSCVYLYFGFGPLVVEPGLTNPEPVGAFLNGKFPDASASDLQYQPAFPNISFDSPLTFTSLPSSNKLVVGQRNGEIYWFENDNNVSQKNLLRNLSDEVGVVWDGGFLGLAVHPEFGQADKNYFYIYYTTKDNQGRDYPDAFISGFGCEREDYWGNFLILKRITVDPNTFISDSNDDLVMIKMRMFSSTHRGGGLVFGNDGFLYLATGDQSAYAKPQNITTNLDGGVLRIDVDQDPSKSHAPTRTFTEDGRFSDEISGIGYGIPNDNPFLSPDGSNFEEYYTIGHRNPHRMTKDRVTGDFYIGEIGESRHEEINKLEVGKNYGWPVYEGNYFRGTQCVDLLDNMPHKAPLLAFSRSEANALIGGYVYRGDNMPDYYGKYICADYGVGEEIWAVDTNTGDYEIITQFSPTNIMSFGEDNNGELYLLSQGDNVTLYKLGQESSLSGSMPPSLSSTEAFEDLENMEPSTGLVPYELIESFWSDGAQKKRWMAIPNNGTHNTAAEKISFSENGDWNFPVGTVLIKHFELPIDETDPNKTKKLETRFSIKASNGSFYFATYKWNEQETDAYLLETGLEEDIPIKKANGSTAFQKWTYPSNQDCIACHSPATGGTLGPRTRYLNSDYTYEKSGVTSNQLVTLSHLGILDEIIDDNKTQQYQTYKALNDNNASLDEKARSYLDLNCAYCHRPGSTGDRAQFDLRLFNDLQQTNLLTAGVNTPLGISGEKILYAGDADKSILYHRINSADPTIMMPPIAKNKVHGEAVQLIEDWINQMGSPSTPPNTGDYRIVNHTTGNTLQVSNAGQNDRANIAAGAYNELDNEHFALEDAGDGFYQFRALHSGRYIDVEMGNTAPDTNVWQYVGNSTDAQLWQILHAGNDSFYIVSKLSGYYLGENPDGNVAVLQNNDGNAIRWKFLPMGAVPDTGIALQTTAISTSEDGSADNVDINLTAAPVEDVVLLVAGSNNTDEYTISPSEITFSSSNWDVPQTITITGADDSEADGNQPYTIDISVDDSRSDSSYHGLSVAINGTNIDDDGTCNGTLVDVTDPVGSGDITSRDDFIPKEDRFKAFDNRKERGDFSKWLDAGGIPGPADPSWIQIVMEQPKRVEAIVITSANDEIGRDPEDFRLMGSNGGAFTELGSWSAQQFDQRYQSRTFEVANPGTYAQYRLEITKNRGDLEMTQLAEIELLGCEPSSNVEIAVTGVALSPTEMEMEIGDTVQLTATLSPDNATNTEITWESQDNAIAEVDTNGNVTAQATGTTNITVTTDDGNFTDTATVTVREPVVDDGTCNGTLVDVTDPVGSGDITSRDDFIPKEDRFKAFDNRKERSDFSKWLDAGGIPGPADPSWIQIVMEQPKRVEAIVITSANDEIGRDPEDFRLMGSNGGAFTELGSWSAQQFDQRYQSRTFEVANPGTYAQYRLEITKNRGDLEMTQLAEIELLGCDQNEPSAVGLYSKLEFDNVYPENDSFIIAPNPVGEARNISLQLTSSLTNKEVAVTVYSMEGKLVHSSKFMNNEGISEHYIQLDRSLPPGIYIMELRNNTNERYRKKIILK